MLIYALENDTIQFQRPENLFFKSVINTKKAPGVEYTPTYDSKRYYYTHIVVLMSYFSVLDQ